MVVMKHGNGNGNSCGRFLWANVGLTGSVDNACIFQASHLYSNIERGNASPDIKKVLTVLSQREIQLPPILLGDSAFPNHSWLQKQFPSTVLSEKESHFNYCLSRARIFTECAFGQLKGRWRLLYRKIEVSQHPLKMSVMPVLCYTICALKKNIASQLGSHFRPKKQQKKIVQRH